MALLKYSSYSDIRVDTGDESFDEDLKDQLMMTTKELISAINAENLTDRIFARLLTQRSKAHQRLCEKIPGATTD